MQTEAPKHRMMPQPRSERAGKARHRRTTAAPERHDAATCRCQFVGFGIWSCGFKQAAAAILLALVLVLGVRADQVTGTLQDIGLNNTVTNITFTPLSTPQSQSPVVIFSRPKTVTTGNDGTFSTLLTTGNYKVTIGNNSKDSFIIAVTNATSSVTNAWTSLITSGASTFQTAVPSYVQVSTLTSKGDLYVGTGSNSVARLAVGTQGQNLSVDTNATHNLVWTNAAGSGTVTSVAMAVPTFLSISGSPITGSGTLALTLSGTALPVTSGGTGGTTASAARTALGLAIGTDVQAYDADLTTYASITPSANVQSLLGVANYSAFRTSLGVAIGTDVQAYDADLTTYAGITPSANVQTLLGAADYSAFKTSLSLNNVENTALSTWAGSANITTLGTITTGTWNGTTLAVANGGTGSTTASAARTALGLVIGTDVQAYDGELAAIAGLTSAADKIAYFTGSGTAAVTDFTSTARSLLDDTSTSAMRTTLGLNSHVTSALPAEIGLACSDETTALSTGTAKVTFRMPYAMTVTAVRASCNTAPVGATITVDINEGGTTILSTKLTIDASETTSTTAATAAVISDASLADDAQITIDIDQVGSSTAGTGLKVWIIGTR